MLWGSSTNKGDIFVMQKKCIRILMNIGPQVSCRPYFIKEKLLTFASLYILESAVFIRTHIQEFKHIKSLRRRHQLELLIPKLEMYKNSPYYRAINIYNKIPFDIRNEGNDKLFFKNLKIYLTNKSYYTIEDFMND